MVQIWRGFDQSRTSFEDSMTREYREIMQRIPYKALLGEELSPDQKDTAYNEVFNYMDLCNEQIFLRMSGRVRCKTWNNWNEGMLTNFSLKLFDNASKEIFDKLPNNFKELRKLREQSYKSDPKKWHGL